MLNVGERLVPCGGEAQESPLLALSMACWQRIIAPLIDYCHRETVALLTTSKAPTCASVREKTETEQRGVIFKDFIPGFHCEKIHAHLNRSHAKNSLSHFVCMSANVNVELRFDWDFKRYY